MNTNQKPTKPGREGESARIDKQEFELSLLMNTLIARSRPLDCSCLTTISCVLITSYTLKEYKSFFFFEESMNQSIILSTKQIKTKAFMLP